MRLLPAILIATSLFICPGCTPVRTVYDEQGNVVTDDEPGGEKDLASTFEKRFDAAFSEKKTQDGVPMTTSSKVSSFQRELDDARRIDKPYATGSFDTGRKLDLRDDGFAGAGKRFTSGKGDIEKATNSMYSTDLRPDFMNDSHGISRSQHYAGARQDARSSLEGRTLDERSRTHYLPDTIPYTREQQNNYVENRRNQAKQPTIIDYQEYYRRHKNSVRQLLGRDNEPL